MLESNIFFQFSRLLMIIPAHRRFLEKIKENPPEDNLLFLIIMANYASWLNQLQNLAESIKKPMHSWVSAAPDNIKKREVEMHLFPSS